jgi:hypothetical protein
MSHVIDPSTISPHATERQRELIAAVNSHGGYRAAARALGIAQSGLSEAVARARRSGGPTTTHEPPGAKRAERKIKRDHAPAPCVPWVESDIYVITAAVNATPVHAGFWAALQRYAERTGARIVCVPLRYKNPTSNWSADQDDDDWWAPEVAPYLYSQRVKLHDGLELLADIRTQPTAQQPLQGMDAITGGSSGIIAHPKLSMATVPTPQNRMPKIMTTTGACTLQSYSPTVAGAKGDFHHTFGALVVEVSDGRFHVRHINAVEDGSFIDLQFAYSEDGVSEAPPAAALVLGDLHVDFIDPQCDAATFGAGGIVSALNPRNIVLHDVLDCYSVSHHHSKDPITLYAKHHSGRGNVLDEVRRCFEYIDSRIPLGTECTIVGSNHNEHLGRWVRDTDPRKDPENALTWAQLYSAMCREARIGDSGLETIDPFEYLARTWLKRYYSDTNFVGRGGCVVKGIELGMHGDRGPNGARGSRKALSKIGVKSVIGHSHSPGIEGGCYQTGTSSRLTLEYSAGSPSSWLHTHCVVYANGKRALINIIDGHWCA